MGGMKWNRARNFKAGSTPVEREEKKRSDQYFDANKHAPRTKAVKFIYASHLNTYHISMDFRGDTTICRAENNWGGSNLVFTTDLPALPRALCNNCRSAAEKHNIHYADGGIKI